MSSVSLYWRVFIINAALVVVATLALALSPATVSSRVVLRELVVLAAGVALVLVFNFVLVRRTLGPLRRLTTLMHRVDLLRPGRRIAAEGGGSEVIELTEAFNAMLDRLEDERRESGRRALQAQEQERRRIALELHDEVGQLLTGVVLGLDGLRRQVPREVGERVEEMQDMVRGGAEHVREIARGLLPQSLEELGLRSALIGLASATADQALLHVERRIATDLPALAPDVQLVVYRVAQESLTNVVRHAGATAAVLSFERVGERTLELRVEDDGRGLEPHDLGAGRGLAGMNERAFYVGGRLELERLEPHGTAVTLRVPVDGWRILAVNATGGVRSPRSAWRSRGACGAGR
jgi:two-component system, NarL family, sensor histidine kinase UhpB